MSIFCSSRPRFDISQTEGVVIIDLNISAAEQVAGFLRAEIERQKGTEVFVRPCVIAFAEQLHTAAALATAVREGTAEATIDNSKDDITASGGAVFSLCVNPEGVIEIDATGLMGSLIAATLRSARDWQEYRGFRLPPAVAAFGAELANTSWALKSQSSRKPIATLPAAPESLPCS